MTTWTTRTPFKIDSPFHRSFGTKCPKPSAALGAAKFFDRDNPGEWRFYAVFSSAINTLQTLVVALGAGLGVWGVVNLLEGYGSDNPGSKSQGIKQLMAGGGIILLGTTLIPVLSTLF